MRTLRAALLAAAAFILMITAAPAAEQPVKLGITPIDVDGNYFDLTLAPGEQATLRVMLQNGGDAPVEARTYAADAYSLVNGGMGIRLADEPVTGATQWINYPADVLVLPAQSQIEREITVRVPDDATAGDYLAGLVIQNATPVAIGNSPAEEGIALNQVLRQVVAVAIDVPGPRVPGLEIGDAFHKAVGDRSIVGMAVGNTGNVHLQPTGELVLRDGNDTEVSRAPVTMRSVYAHTDTTVEVPLEAALPDGSYTVEMTLTDAATGVSASASRPLVITTPVPQAGEGSGVFSGAAVRLPESVGGIPTIAVVGGVLAVIALGLAAVVVTRRRSHQSAQPAGVGTAPTAPAARSSERQATSIRRLAPRDHRPKNG